MAGAVTSGNPESWQAYCRSYERALGDEQVALFERTAKDSRFLRALAVANPALARRASEVDPLQLGAKRRRHLATSLYRYLSRAASRPTPRDLWAGATLAEWSATTRVLPSRDAVIAAPDLRPFRAILARLSRSSPYRAHCRWQMNPTLRRRDTDWTFLVVGAGGWSWKAVPAAPELDRALVALGPVSPRPLAELIEACSPLAALPTGVAIGQLQLWIEIGLLVGGIDVPAQFECVWEALDVTKASLREGDKKAWASACDQLREICGRIEADFARLELPSLLELFDAARRVVGHLVEELAVSDVRLPQTVIRCDWIPGHRVELGADLRRRIEEAIVEYRAFQHRYGLGPTFRRMALRRLLALDGVSVTDVAERFALDGSEVAQCWETLARNDKTRMVDEVLRAWADLLVHDRDTVTASLTGDEAPWPPAAYLALAPGRCLEGLVVDGMSADVSAVFARHRHLAGSPTDPSSLSGWLLGCLDRAARSAGVELLDLGVVPALAPNAAARPRIIAKVLTPWQGAAAPWATARLEIHRCGAPLIRMPGDGTPKAVFSFTSANQATDPLTATLLLSSFRYSPFAEVVASRLRLPGDDRDGMSPEIRLPSGAVVRRRTSAIVGDALHRLTAGSRASRFAAWQRLARQRAFPEMLCVARDGQPALLIHRDSVLGVEAALGGAGSAQTIRVTEAPQDWLRCPDGPSLVAQLMVPFAVSDHSWSAPCNPHN